MNQVGRLRRAAFALATFVACCPPARALDPSLDVSQYAHTAWKFRDGFTKGAIYSIAQTPDGYLWLGTEFGLVRFDGVRAVPWQPPPDQHLPSTFILSLLTARDGTLWIGTSRGLASWKGGKLTQYPELGGQYVGKLLEDREGTVWAGGLGIPTGRLCSIQNGSVHCDGENGSLGKAVSSLYEDSRGTLWVGVRDGLWRWKPGPPKFYSLPGEPNGIRGLGEDTDGTILVGWHGGIQRFVDGKTEAYPLPGIVQSFAAKRLLRDRDGSLWIGTQHRGLVHVHQGRTGVFSPSDGLSGEDTNALFEDREGSIWVATPDGLDRFRDFTVATFTIKQGLSDAVVGSVLADRDGGVWLTAGDSLDRWNNGQITTYGKSDKKLNGRIPHSLFQDDRGRIWVCTRDGIGHVENGRFIPVKGIPGGVVHAMAEDTGGNLWIANQDAGLFRLSTRGEVQQIPWPTLGHKDFATALGTDPLRGGLWLGFFNGGVAYLRDGQVRVSSTAADGLGEGTVNRFRFDSDGTVWAATASGLSRLKNGRVATLTSKNGLPCDAVHSVIRDNSYSFWLYMPCGLVRVARPELDAWAAAVDREKDTTRMVQAVVFDSSDGVRTSAAAGGYTPRVARSSDGKLWFATVDGVSVIDPRHLSFNKLPPPVHIEQITADDKTYPVSNGMYLPALVRNLDIDYMALSLAVPEKVHFRVKLEGQDEGWRELVNDRHVHYTNLAPKHYRFRVTACNNSGVWNEEGESLDFVIPPVWYETTLFRALCAAAFLTLLWAAYRLRVVQLEAQEKKFREAVETMPALAFIARPDGYRTFVNCGWVEYTGLTVQQASGSGWQAAVHPDDLKRVIAKWRSSAATGEPLEYETRLRRGTDGSYRWFQARATALRDKRGKVVKWCGVVTDIEDRKHAERLQADLAHTNRVSMLGELAASISHELKQPITATITNARTTQRWLKCDQPDLEEVRLSAERIEKDGARATEIIDRLRSLYKKTPPKRELVDVNETIGEMALMMRGEATRFGVSIRTDLGAGLPKITADRVQLQQVLMNLMLNGIEAMNDTGGVLTVKSEPPDGQVVISVSDTGVGLPAGKADRIFDAFFTTKPQGSGMGLAISRSIIESHDGRLWATPNDGPGASFHFSLPTATEAAEATAAGA
jgi:PAS domain S-box-containing protein